MSAHRPRKRFGQHFLTDQTIIDRIINAIHPQQNDLIVEIGPGEGVLTAHLATACALLHAIEIDRDLVRRLNTRFASQEHVHIHELNALDSDYCAFADTSSRIRLVGNLPYNISTPLLIHLMQYTDCIQDMNFMLQKEVVDRIVAVPGNKSYGRLSIIVQVFCETEALFDISADAFRPPPKVMSAFIRLRPRKSMLLPRSSIPDLQALTQKLFSRRRKTLRKILQGEMSAESLDALGIDSSRRPETLSIPELITLLQQLQSLPGRPS